MGDGCPPASMSFPQKVHTEDEDFVIELDDGHMGGPQDGYSFDDRSRCKRRKRCGQCGPCQVKENCMKCHFCIRKDVLKQTCIYRKCVYLRSKPKPYTRPQQSPQGRGGTSPPRDATQTSPLVKSPPVVPPHPGLSFPEPGPFMPEPRQENHPYFPAQLPQQTQVGTQQSNGYLSPPHPSVERTPSLPNTATNMNMQINMSPHVQNHATSPPLPKPPDPTSPIVPQPVNSPVAALPGIPVSSCSSIPHIPPMPAVGPTIPPMMQQMSNNALPNIPPIANMPGLSDRPVNDFRHPDQFSLGPHHPHPHFSAVHPHNVMQHRDSSLFGEHSRIPHMNFTHTNPMEPLGRGPTDSSCMYHPGLPYSMPGHYQPAGPTFLTGATEMNPFRSNFLNSFPPGYSYPPDRGFGPLPFSRLGMSPSASFPQYPGQTGGYGVGGSLSQQYYNSQHGCPKNGSRPPVSPSIDDVKVLQEGYKNDESHLLSADKIVNKIKTEKNDQSCQDHNDSGSQKDSESLNDSLSEQDRDTSEKLNRLNIPGLEHLRPWNDFFTHRALHRYDSFLSPGSKSSSTEPWRLSPWYSPQRDDARSRASTSTQSSDFECEVISIDDQQVNALIRSDGCNSIEIEFDNRSVCSNDSSPRKLPSRSSCASDLMTPEKGLSGSSEDRLLFCPWMDERNYRKSILGDREIDMCVRKVFSLPGTSQGKERKEPVNNKISKPSSSLKQNQKSCFKDSVHIRQDLGEEGILNLELPGHKVTIENVEFTDEMLKHCSNIDEFKEYIMRNTSENLKMISA